MFSDRAMPMPNAFPDRWTLLDLGRMAYASVWDIQRKMHEQVLANQGGPMLILVEHDPVITVSQRPSAREHLTASPAMLARLGIDVQPTDRGGDITYHGPGQLVAYPILRLADYGLMVGSYMRLLEQVVIDLLGDYSIPAGREADYPGVWTPPLSPPPLPPSPPEKKISGHFPLKSSAIASSSDSESSAAPPLPSSSDLHSSEPSTDALFLGRGSEVHSRGGRKICAMGVRVKRNVTLHGLALNVTTDLSHFQTIVPCGLVGRSVTSMQQWLGEKTPAMPEVKQKLADRLRQHLDQARRNKRSEPERTT